MMPLLSGADVGRVVGADARAKAGQESRPEPGIRDPAIGIQAKLIVCTA
jgi:hypothetical protein